SYLADPLRKPTVLHLPVIVTTFTPHRRLLCCFKTLHK
ncbi:hypothetical protein N306_07869, partial [Opisthocomus hoazin]